MPWSYPDNVPDSMKYMKPSIQKKAISIANAVLRNGGEEGTAIATGIKGAKRMHDKKGSIVKVAAEQQKNWAERHPLLSSGLALAGGIAAADMGVNAYKFKSMGLKSGFKTMGDALKHGAKEGSLYGGILGATGPILLHGVMKKKVQE